MRRVIYMCTIAALMCTSSASAATRVWISEFSSIPSVTGGGQGQMAALPAVTNQQLDISSGVQSSAAFNGSTRYIRVVCELQCAVKAGGTASATDTVLPAYSPEYFGVSSGGTISVILAP